jgi:hypothetical protein
MCGYFKNQLTLGVPKIKHLRMERVNGGLVILNVTAAKDIAASSVGKTATTTIT